MSKVSDAIMRGHRAQVAAIHRGNAARADQRREKIAMFKGLMDVRKMVKGFRESQLMETLRKTSKSPIDDPKTGEPFDLYQVQDPGEKWGDDPLEKGVRFLTGASRGAKLNPKYQSIVDQYNKTYEKMEKNPDNDKMQSLFKQTKKRLKKLGWEGDELDEKTIEVAEAEFDLKYKEGTAIKHPVSGKTAGEIMLGKKGELDDLIKGVDWKTKYPKLAKERTEEKVDINEEVRLAEEEFDEAIDLDTKDDQLAIVDATTDTDLPSATETIVPYGFQGDKNYSYKVDTEGNYYVQKKGSEEWSKMVSSGAEGSVRDRVDSYIKDQGTGGKFVGTADTDTGTKGKELMVQLMYTEKDTGKGIYGYYDKKQKKYVGSVHPKADINQVPDDVLDQFDEESLAQYHQTVDDTIMEGSLKSAMMNQHKIQGTLTDIQKETRNELGEAYVVSSNIAYNKIQRKDENVVNTKTGTGDAEVKSENLVLNPDLKDQQTLNFSLGTNEGLNKDKFQNILAGSVDNSDFTRDVDDNIVGTDISESETDIVSNLAVVNASEKIDESKIITQAQSKPNTGGDLETAESTVQIDTGADDIKVAAVGSEQAPGTTNIPSPAADLNEKIGASVTGLVNEEQSRLNQVWEKGGQALGVLGDVKTGVSSVSALMAETSGDKISDTFNKTAAATSLASLGGRAVEKIATKAAAKAAAKTGEKVAISAAGKMGGSIVKAAGPIGTAISVGADIYDTFKDDPMATSTSRAMKGTAAVASTVAASVLATNFWNPVGWVAGGVAAGIKLLEVMGIGQGAYQGRQTGKFSWDQPQAFRNPYAYKGIR